ncbi:cyclopropane fatty acyl phospholipid synthase [Synechococcus sp. HJ21-Hayes]|jgi:cyclopropane-fatty-acyl-phospholipid synthase|uniref:cyclopropane fatty acyl phospholipid synthase n=1 Tax=unclassified Synechococcus TaxID=2626047 RepID=UPI0020CB8FBE|nr:MULTISPECIES: cyclopropane fatty acyl phospholipid synthase [unclassified Synechococcus]MCP9831052.1 cyclopropane fatty acyl phospholipid synthase [Synechococcus sp. JJ3a-Johnson]MCP9853239.1 cyclopropane fatty acyl phospholipid synthase [Synechococcus sp. HJ21-Hayes]
MPIPAAIATVAKHADVQFNGERPWDLQVHNPALFNELLRQGSLALGNSYVRGDWDCEQLDELISRLLQANGQAPLSKRLQLLSLAELVRERWLNPQSLRRAFVVGQRHYDIDPRVYAAMLDPQMVYSCGYWRQADDLNTAQEHKLRLICEKLQLEPGQTLLDIGCGWGSLAAYAARNYGVTVMGITVSSRQARFIQERLENLPIQVALCDYRKLPQLVSEPFDRVVSIGMFEHVGPRNHNKFHNSVNQLLHSDGLALLQTIGSDRTTHHTDGWIDTHIFPGGRLPSATQFCRGFESDFLLEDWENFGKDYDRTLMAWWQNFDAAWPALQHDIHHDFYRFWRYYLLSCAGFFRSRQGQLWQVVLSKKTRNQAYESWRPARRTSPLQTHRTSASEQSIFHQSS